MECIFLRLPVYTLIRIFSKMVGLKDLIRLDSATTNLISREVLLNILCHPAFTIDLLYTRIYSNNIVQWVLTRGLKPFVWYTEYGNLNSIDYTRVMQLHIEKDCDLQLSNLLIQKCVNLISVFGVTLPILPLLAECKNAHRLLQFGIRKLCLDNWKKLIQEINTYTLVFDTFVILMDESTPDYVFGEITLDWFLQNVQCRNMCIYVGRVMKMKYTTHGHEVFVRMIHHSNTMTRTIYSLFIESSFRRINITMFSLPLIVVFCEGNIAYNIEIPFSNKYKPIKKTWNLNIVNANLSVGAHIILQKTVEPTHMS